MSTRDWLEVNVRSDDQVVRLAAELVREEVAFRIDPVDGGWWRVRAKPIGNPWEWRETPPATRTFRIADLYALEQATRLPR